jgi:hypothetical protein
MADIFGYEPYDGPDFRRLKKEIEEYQRQMKSHKAPSSTHPREFRQFRALSFTEARDNQYPPPYTESWSPEGDVWDGVETVEGLYGVWRLDCGFPEECILVDSHDLTDVSDALNTAYQEGLTEGTFIGAFDSEATELILGDSEDE